MKTNSLRIVAFFSLSLLFISCKNESKKDSYPSGNKNIPRLEGNNATDAEALKKTYEDLLKTGAINADQFKEYMEKIQEMKNGNSTNESDSDFRKNQLDKYTKKIREKNSIKTEAQLEAEAKTANLRKLLGTTDNSFIEENITRYSLWGNRDKRESLKQLETASKEEANKIIASYFEISQKELDLLRPLPSKQKIRTEIEARTIAKQPLPQSIEAYLNSGQASSKFKAMMTSRKNDMIIFSGDVIKASEKARKEFYKNNPGWYGEATTTGNTYRDSRNKFIYLPLGELTL